MPDSQRYLLGLLASCVDDTTFELNAEVHRVGVLLYRFIPEERG